MKYFKHSKKLSKPLISLFGALLMIALTPSAAYAGGSGITLNLPGLTIGVHDRDRKRYRQRHHYRHHNDYYYESRNRRNKRFYNQRHYNDRHYNKRGNRYYNTRRYNDHYYYGGRGNNDRRYYNSRRSDVCPINGYSRNYNRSRNCYKHKGHFHCS